MKIPKKKKKPTKKKPTNTLTTKHLPTKSKAVKNFPVKVKSHTKNPVEYYQCMKTCCKNKKGQRITQIAHECKTNALTINAKLTAEKARAINKVAKAYQQMGQGLGEFIKATQ